MVLHISSFLSQVQDIPEINLMGSRSLLDVLYKNPLSSDDFFGTWVSMHKFIALSRPLSVSLSKGPGQLHTLQAAKSEPEGWKCYLLLKE